MRRPLLESTAGGGAGASAEEGGAQEEQPIMGLYAKKPRLQFLDVLRGLTIAWMIFVDNAGYSWPMIDHCPWDGIALADFVMPNFDFIVGVSCVLSLKKFVAKSKDDPKQKWVATQKICIRTAKMFVLGIATQCGVDLFVYNLSLLRIMGILQRVACCYFVAAMFEVWLPVCPAPSVDDAQLIPARYVHLRSAWQLFSAYRYQWLGAALLLITHTAILYGVDVPSYTVQDGNTTTVHHCGRGKLTPDCNAAQYIDRHLLGFQHMYFPSNGGGDGRDVTYQRLQQCSTCAPGKCGDWSNGVGYDKSVDLKPPAWCCIDNGTSGPCTIPFDPEGIVSTLSCVVASVFGLHYGHVLTLVQGHAMRLTQWFALSVCLVLVGTIMHFSHSHCTEGWHGICTGGMAWNTDLYSISFLFFTVGISGLLLCFFYVLNDIYARPCWQTATQPFRWMGLNAITIYLLAEGGIPEWVLGMFYLNSDPDQSLVNILYPSGRYWGFDEDTDWLTRVDAAYVDAPSMSVAVLMWVLTYVGFWMFVAWLLHKNKIYVKI